MAEQDTKTESETKTEAEVKETDTKAQETEVKESKTEVKVEETKTPETEEKKTPWFQRRIDELTREKHDAKRTAEGLQSKLAQLEAEMAQFRTTGGNQPVRTPEAAAGSPLTEAQINARIEALAEERAKASEFTKECNKIYDKGTKTYEDFAKSLDSFASLGGLNTPAGANLVAAAMETDEPHRVIYSLSKDLDEASRIMSLPPIRQAAALVKYASTLDRKSTSKAPAPIKALNGNAAREARLDDDSMSMDEWVEARNKAVAEKRKRA